MKVSEKIASKNEENCVFSSSSDGYIPNPTSNLKNSSNFGKKGPVYLRIIIIVSCNQALAKRKGFFKKMVILLLNPYVRPRFLPSDGPNMGFYGLSTYPGVCRKSLDQ